MITSCLVTDRVVTEQLLLPLPMRTALGAADFLVADSNQDAVRWLDAWPDWPGGCLLLHGPAASGKSHLAAIWAVRASAVRMAAADLTLAQALDPKTALAIDGIAGMPEPQRLFHLVNTARARNLSLFLTARQPAAAWSTGLADLDSRLRAMPSVGLDMPDDSLLGALAAKLFADRQITVSDAVIAFMLSRLERSCAAVAAAVALLDKTSLAQRRAVTVPLARETLIALTDDLEDH
jgi:chromosomal replication initiation ATPase DnaA